MLSHMLCFGVIAVLLLAAGDAVRFTVAVFAACCLP